MLTFGLFLHHVESRTVVAPNNVRGKDLGAAWFCFLLLCTHRNGIVIHVTRLPLTTQSIAKVTPLSPKKYLFWLRFLLLSYAWWLALMLIQTWLFYSEMCIRVPVSRWSAVFCCAKKRRTCVLHNISLLLTKMIQMIVIGHFWSERHIYGLYRAFSTTSMWWTEKKGSSAIYHSCCYHMKTSNPTEAGDVTLGQKICDVQKERKKDS